jgi:tetratricopeptide (TPR) repeat protein
VSTGKLDPLAEFRQGLRELYAQARRPTYRTLGAHADRQGRVLRISTVSDLLNGPAIPRWDTVEAFVRSCLSYALAQRVDLPAELADLDRWHHAYRAMETAVDELAVRRERPAGQQVRTGGHRPAVPAQLPADAPAFTGRARHLAELDKLLPRGGGGTGRAATVVISAIDGTAGVGKTALAVHWAHQVRDRFPDGQLYVNLRGFGPDRHARDPATVLPGFLDALGVAPQQIPADLDARAALYRSVLADRRVLILLDNASDSAQVRPLIPGTPDSLAVVTSRNQLTGLVATHCAHPVTLDLLTTEEARDLLARRVGTDRVAAEPDATVEIISRCARLPLALTLVAAHATLQPETGLRDLARQLRDASARWHTLTGDDPATDVRAVFSWSYQVLSPGAARLFRLLGLHPGPDLPAPAAASLTGLPVAQAQSLLAELTRNNLLSEHAAGRYTCHDLLRAYAVEQLTATEPVQARLAAIHRALDHYLRTAYAADRLLSPHRDPIELPESPPGVTPEELSDASAALDWFTVERPALIAAVQQAVDAGFYTYAWQLAWALGTVLDLRGQWDDWIATQRIGLDAAERCDDQAAQALAHRLMGRAQLRTGNAGEAALHLKRALLLCQRTGDRGGAARVYLDLAAIAHTDYRQMERYAARALELYQALDHRLGQVRALNAIGWAKAHLEELHSAADYLRQALRTCDGLDSRPEHAAIWDSLGFVHQRLGEYPAAIDYYGRALEVYAALRYTYPSASTLVQLGEVHLAAGDRPAAGHAWHSALTILDEIHHPDAEQVRSRLHELRPGLPESPAARPAGRGGVIEDD